jgi:hypothetical protein
VVRERKVVFQAARRASLRQYRRWIIENQIHFTPPSVQLALLVRTANGDVESKTRLAEDALESLS